MQAASSFTPPGIRDRFLAALDEANDGSAHRFALHLTTSRNPLPGLTCQQLGLPMGSSYGAAARWVLDRHRDQALEAPLP
jgi:hypothetical protein